MKKTILAFGEVLWDILPSCTVLGGAPFNFAYRANSLGDTGLMISRLSRDGLGNKACGQMGYDGWFGLNLFPYQDDPIDFMKLSVENLRFAQSVVDLMNKKGAKELRAKGTDGPAMSRLIRDCIRQVK